MQGGIKKAGYIMYPARNLGKGVCVKQVSCAV